MVRDPVHLVFPHFCGTDIHAAVNLHGIGGNDFSAKPFRQFDADSGFAGSGGPCDNNQFLHTCRMAHQTMRPNFFSTSSFVMIIIVGRPCGQ